MIRMFGILLLAAAAVLAPARGVDALTVSPPFFDFSLNPGDTVLDAVQLYNEDEMNPVTIYPVIQNFTYSEGDEEGTPIFYSANEDRGGTALAKWVTAETTPITIGPLQRANVAFAINVPKDGVQPGGHFGGILFSTAPPSDQEGSFIGVAANVGTLILVRVSGDVEDRASIAEFGFQTKKLWYNYRPIDMFVRVENSGNTHLRPTGNVFIKNWYGRQVASIVVNEGFRSVLPSSIRRYEFGWNGNDGRTDAEPDGFVAGLGREWRNFGFGKYKAELYLTYGNTAGNILAETREFTIWPWRLMIVGGIGGVALLAVGWLLVRRYNASVIRRYERARTE